MRVTARPLHTRGTVACPYPAKFLDSIPDMPNRNSATGIMKSRKAGIAHDTGVKLWWIWIIGNPRMLRDFILDLFGPIGANVPNQPAVSGRRIGRNMEIVIRPPVEGLIGVARTGEAENGVIASTNIPQATFFTLEVCHDARNKRRPLGFTFRVRVITAKEDIKDQFGLLP